MHVKLPHTIFLAFSYRIIIAAGRIRPTNHELAVRNNSINSALNSTLLHRTRMAGHTETGFVRLVQSLRMVPVGYGLIFQVCQQLPITIITSSSCERDDRGI